VAARCRGCVTGSRAGSRAAGAGFSYPVEPVRRSESACLSSPAIAARLLAPVRSRPLLQSIRPSFLRPASGGPWAFAEPIDRRDCTPEPSAQSRLENTRCCGILRYATPTSCAGPRSCGDPPGAGACPVDGLWTGRSVTFREAPGPSGATRHGWPGDRRLARGTHRTERTFYCTADVQTAARNGAGREPWRSP
jgi:hypothetical protein